MRCARCAGRQLGTSKLLTTTTPVASKFSACAGVRGKSVTHLDCSRNSLQEVAAEDLPATLEELRLTGNRLRRLPPNLHQLQSLSKLAVASNELDDADAVFSCPALLHASLCYNRLSNLQTQPTSVRRSPSTCLHLVLSKRHHPGHTSRSSSACRTHTPGSRSNVESP